MLPLMLQTNRLTEPEIELWKDGKQLICGIDEVNIYSLAGPIVACAIILDFEKPYIDKINDSKQVPKKYREEMESVIKERSIAYALGEANVSEVDKLNIYYGGFLARKKALENLIKIVEPDYVIVDGNQIVKEIDIKQEAIPQGDEKSITIAAASILAKVHFDNIMLEYSEKHPLYGFDHNTGCPTPEHKKAILKYGLLPIHRKEFCKTFLKIWAEESLDEVTNSCDSIKEIMKGISVQQNFKF